MARPRLMGLLLRLRYWRPALLPLGQRDNLHFRTGEQIIDKHQDHRRSASARF